MNIAAALCLAAMILICIIALNLLLTTGIRPPNIRIPGVVPIEIPDLSCPYGHRIRDGQLIEFTGTGTNNDQFQIRIGPCSRCGECIMRTTVSQPGMTIFRACSTQYALTHASKEILAQLRKIGREPAQHRRLQRKLKRGFFSR